MLRLAEFFNGATVLAVNEVVNPENRIRLLLAAVVRRAAYDIALYKNDTRLVNRRLAVQAQKWMFDDRAVMSMKPGDRFMSFQNICEVLDQDPGVIRRKTMNLQLKDVKKFEQSRRY